MINTNPIKCLHRRENSNNMFFLLVGWELVVKEYINSNQGKTALFPNLHADSLSVFWWNMFSWSYSVFIFQVRRIVMESFWYTPTIYAPYSPNSFLLAHAVPHLFPALPLPKHEAVLWRRWNWSIILQEMCSYGILRQVDGTNRLRNGDGWSDVWGRLFRKKHDHGTTSGQPFREFRAPPRLYMVKGANFVSCSSKR